MSDSNKLRDNLQQAMNHLREGIEISIELKTQGKEFDREVIDLWEQFLGEFWGYIRKRSKEVGFNLLGGISFNKLWR
ncbi:MAG: hypothetical protein M0Z31_07855 [Clostridia bacterium]|nr:hypothetical protein [Clostridia bacterium]